MSQEEKFIKYLEGYKNLILKVASIYCRAEEDRKDLMQEIILQLWRSFPNYNDSFASSTWTYRIALNVSISHVRKTMTRNKAIQASLTNVAFIEIEDEDMEERLKLLYDSIQILKPIEKAIVSLHLDGCKNKEISDVLGISPSNVSTRLVRIKERLKNNIRTIKS